MKTNAVTFPAPAKAEGKRQRQPSHAALTSPKTMSNRSAILIILIAVVGYLASASFALSEPVASQIAEDPTIRGKGKDGNTAIAGSHVFVVYHLPDGSEWIVDNEIPAPKQVPPEASPLQLVFLLSGDPSAPVDVELQNGLNSLSFF